MTRSLILVAACAAACAAAFVLRGGAVAPAPTQADLDAARFAGLLGILGVGPLLKLFTPRRWRPAAMALSAYRSHHVATRVPVLERWLVGTPAEVNSCAIAC